MLLNFYLSFVLYSYCFIYNYGQSCCEVCCCEGGENKNKNKNNLSVYLDTSHGSMDINNLNNPKINYIDTEKYKNKVKDVFNEIEKVKEEDRIFIQSDTEGKKFNIISILQVAGIIDIKKPITVYYDIYTGDFKKETNKTDDIKVEFFEVNKNFKGTYIHLGDIVDRCNRDNGCIYSLLYLLYVKRELGDKIRLICGNHELGFYALCEGCDCCQAIKNKIFIIVFRAISKGEIKYYDTIEIGSVQYILTHKVVSSLDTKKIKLFLNERCDITDIESKVGDDFKKLIDVVNEKFKEHFGKYFERYKDDFSKGLELIDLMNYAVIYDQTQGFIVEKYRATDLERIKNRGGHFLPNQICGHDHHSIENCYINDSNILFVDNFSCDMNNRPKVNIHFFDRNKELNEHKGFVFVKDLDGPNVEVNTYDNFNSD